MSKPWKIISVINLAAWICCSLYFLFGQQEEVVFIDTYKVYNGFDMKKQLQKQLEQTQQTQKQHLDSMELEIRLAIAHPKAELLRKGIEYKTQELQMRREQLSQEQEELAERFDSQIWAQLNQYISDYGKEKHLRFIFGANGNGSLMYGQTEQDITENMITYVNQRHQGL